MAREDLNPGVRNADLANFDSIVGLVEECRSWALQRGYKQSVDLWDREDLIGQIEKKQVYVCEDPDMVATFSLQAINPERYSQFRIIPEITSDSAVGLSLSHLAVARDRAGEGLGYCILDKACEVTHGRGKSFLRLGCWAGNTKLRAYYISAGFSLIAIAVRHDDENFRVALFQRRC